MDPDPVDLVLSGYDAFYAAWGRSSALRRIWQQHAAGLDFPEEFDHISFLTLDRLTSMADGMALAADDLLVDLACGAGGPGLWVARESGCRLIGIDQSAVAVVRAGERAARVGLVGRAEFRQGTFASTGLDGASVDAVMTADAFHYAPDKSEAIAEIARILRPGGRFALFAFELDPERVSGLPFWLDPVSDYRPLLDRAGFDVERYDQVTDWSEQVTTTYEAILAGRAEIEAELGEAATTALCMEAAATIGLQPYCGHVLGLARRR